MVFTLATGRLLPHYKNAIDIKKIHCILYHLWTSHRPDPQCKDQYHKVARTQKCKVKLLKTQYQEQRDGQVGEKIPPVQKLKINVQWTYFVDAYLSSILRPKQGAWMQGMQGVQGPKQGALASPLSPPLANSRAPTSVAAADTTSPYVNGDPHYGISVKRTLKSC